MDYSLLVGIHNIDQIQRDKQQQQQNALGDAAVDRPSTSADPESSSASKTADGSARIYGPHSLFFNACYQSCLGPKPWHRQKSIMMNTWDDKGGQVVDPEFDYP